MGNYPRELFELAYYFQKFWVALILWKMRCVKRCISLRISSHVCTQIITLVHLSGLINFWPQSILKGEIPMFFVECIVCKLYQIEIPNPSPYFPHAIGPYVPPITWFICSIWSSISRWYVVLQAKVFLVSPKRALQKLLVNLDSWQDTMQKGSPCQEKIEGP